VGEDCESGPDQFDECNNQTVIKDCNIMIDPTGVFNECLDIGLDTSAFHQGGSCEYHISGIWYP